MEKTPRERKALLTDLLLYTLGSIAYGLAISLFTAPNAIAPGGVTGLATMVSTLSGRVLGVSLPIGLLSLVMNLPLLAAAWWRLGGRFTLRTLVCILLSSVWTDLFGAALPPFRGERILVCIFGGALMGLGVGLILSRGGTTGGTEIVARLLERRWPHLSIGRLMLLVDGVVIGLSALVYGQLESTLYATVLVFIASLVTDWLVYGGRRGKVALILSACQPQLVERIMTELRRGATLLQGAGAYTGHARNMILCAVSPEEVYPLKRLVLEEDPQAFFMLLSTDEVLGSGWPRRG